MDKALLTVGEVALLLRLSEKVVYRNIKTLPGAFKVFGSWRIDRDTLLAELKKQATPKEQSRVSSKDDRHGLL